MATKVAFVSRKGGVGKSSGLQNVAAAIRRLRPETRTLAVEGDSQGSLTENLGYDLDALEQAEKTLVHALVSNGSIADFILTDRPLHLVAGGDELEELQDQLVANPETVALYRRFFTPVEERYDFMLLDCPGGLNLFTKNAMAYADLVVLTVETKMSAYRSLLRFFPRLEQARLDTNPRLAILGVLPMRFEKYETVHQGVVQALREGFGDRMTVFDPIEKRADYDKAEALNMSILEAFPNTPGMDGFYQLAEALLNHHG